MKLVDWADSVYRDLDQSSDISIPAIAAWGRMHIGDLNNLIFTTYTINSTTLEPTDSSGVELGEQEGSIYKKIYNIHYWTRQIKNSLGVGGVDLLQSAESDGGKLTFVNRNQLSLSYLQLKKDTKLELDKMINYYLYGKATPLSVDSDDTNVVSTSSRYAPNSIDGSNFIDNGR